MWLICTQQRVEQLSNQLYSWSLAENSKRGISLPAADYSLVLVCNQSLMVSFMMPAIGDCLMGGTLDLVGKGFRLETN